MHRIDGFIDINEFLNIDQLSDFKASELLNYLKRANPTVNIEKNNGVSQFVFSFIFNGEKYYFKYDSFASPYNELLAYFVANDLNISSVPYDLAKVGNFRGVISKDFKVVDAKYIQGAELLKQFYDDPKYWQYNNLEDIWDCLEEYYRNITNHREIIKELMYQLVKMFVFDILTGQVDRHGHNWGIVEYTNGKIELQPIIDNSRIFMDRPDLLVIQMNANKNNIFMADSLEYYLDVSSKEFRDLFKDSLWVISEENLVSIFSRIERQTNAKIPDEIKENYRLKFRDYYNFFERELGYKQNIL